MVLILILGICASSAVARLLHEQETNRILTVLEKQADERVSRLERSIELDIEILHSLKAFFDASEWVSRDEFALYASHVLDEHESVQALEWIPRVRYEERREYERRAQDEGHPAFRITERLAQGAMVPAAKRDEYFPVYFVEPMAGNEAAFGFDLASNEARRVALASAWDSGLLQATGAVTLVQEQGTQKGFIVFYAIYDGVPTNLSERRALLLGFVLGVFRIADILEREMLADGGEAIGYPIELIDESATGTDRLLYRNGADFPGSSHAALALHRPLQEVAGRRWVLVSMPSADWIASRRSGRTWAAFSVGILLTMMLAGYVGASERRTAQVERLVAIRTRALNESELRTRTVIDTVVSGIITIDERGIIETVNPAAERLFGYRLEELVGRNVATLMPEPYASAHDGYLEYYLRTGIRKIIGKGREVTGLRCDGSEFPADLAVSEMRFGEERKFIGLVTNISERKEAERALEEANRELERLSSTDPLTELANRRSFDEELDREWKRAIRASCPVSLLMIDIDYFKLFNDRYGHPAGDACLQSVAGALREALLRSSDLVARYGGEEFVALLPETDVEGAIYLAERCRAAILALGVPHEDSEVHEVVTASIGCSTVNPGRGSPPGLLLERADRALYEVKERGRDGVLHESVLADGTPTG